MGRCVSDYNVRQVRTAQHSLDVGALRQYDVTQRDKCPFRHVQMAHDSTRHDDTVANTIELVDANIRHALVSARGELLRRRRRGRQVEQRGRIGDILHVHVIESACMHAVVACLCGSGGRRPFGVKLEGEREGDT